MAVGCVAHEPPRSTLYSDPKNTSLYSRYGNDRKPGYAEKSDDGHSHTSPISCRHPHGLAPSGKLPAVEGEKRRLVDRLARAADGSSSPHGYRRLTPSGVHEAAFSHS